MKMWIFGLISVIVLGTGITLFQAPSFGENPDKHSVESFSNLSNYNSKKKKFKNNIETKTAFSFKDFRKVSKEYSKKDDSISRKPNDNLIPIDTTEWQKNDTSLWISWLGHSSQYVNLEGITILIDPVFSKRCSPFQWVGSKRFHPFPHDTTDFSEIDAVVISHDHYDHLDIKTIRSLSKKVSQFIVPLGVGGHLKKWGVSQDKIIELNWWDSVKVDHVTFYCTPARHFSGRGITHQNETLWASWSFVGQKKRLFYSGDTGYFEAFKTIGERLGPFDIAVIQTGAYDSLWADIHMFPTEVIQTFKDLKAEKLIPVHWGTFNLALHDWKEPAIWLKNASKNGNIPVIFPKLNEQVFVEDSIHLKKKEWFE